MAKSAHRKSLMSLRRKKTTRDYEALYDQQLGENLLDPTMKGFDGFLDYHPVVESTNANYEKTLVVWDAYAKKQTKEQGKTPDPRDLITLKHFVKFYARAMHCKKTQDNPNGLPKPNTVRTRVREFTSAYNRRSRHERPIPEDFRRSITNYIKGTLVHELGLPTGKKVKRPQTYFTSEIYKTVQAFN